MAVKRNIGVLIAGLLLICGGAVVLAVNLWGVPVHWKLALKLLIPGLLLLAGLLKLIRHFTWSDEELLNRPGRASLLGGIFWASLGLVILLDVIGVLDAIGFFGDYWPLILIAYGLGKIIDYYRLKMASRVRMGEIFGVVFIAVFGWSLARISDAHLPLIAEFGLGNLPWTISLDSPVAKHEFKATETVEIEEIESVEIRNLYGNVSVEPAENGSAQIELLKVIRDDSKNVARKIAKKVVVVAEKSNSTLTIGTNRKELGDIGKKLNTHLVLKLPETLHTRIVNSYGDIRVEQRLGNCRLENSYGRIDADGIEGNVSVSGRYQGIRVENVEGTVTVTNRRAPVIVTDIAGSVEVTTDYDLVRAESIRGNLAVHNQFGEIRIREIEGEVQIEGKGSSVNVADITEDVAVSNSRESVVATNLQQALTIDTSNSQVEVARISGPVEIRAEFSEISAAELEKGIQLQGRGSQVALTEVMGGLRIETSLRSVSVNDFSGPVTIQNEYGEVSVETSRGPLGPVRISNKNGEISISIPAETNCVLSAHSVGGEIVSDFGPKPQTSEGSVSLLETKIGNGGPQIDR